MRTIATMGALLAACAATAATAADFRATGNEPGWSVVKSESEISFQTMNGEKVSVSPVPAAQTGAGVEIYLSTAPEPFLLVIADRICVDTMSGMPRPSTVMVQSGGTRYAGCGGDPASLLRGEWAVSQIDGKSVDPEAPPSIAFDADGQLSGAASCNRYFGKYRLTGEGLTISPSGLSRMACPEPVMAQETAFLNALGKTARFEIRADMSLVLHGADGPSIIAYRKS